MQRPRVLLVEDDQALAECLVEELEGEGFQAIHAAHAAAAFERLGDQDIVAIVSDLSFPAKPGSPARDDVGFAFITGARRLRPGLPIVVASGLGGDPEVVERARGLGATAVLAKPFSLNEQRLVDVLRGCLAEPGQARPTARTTTGKRKPA